jgi:transcriptional regulator with XRE-family HTH domain
LTQANKLPEIRKEAFKKARESAGLSTQELAVKACLSNRQIEHLENGETASFYGAQVKYTAAKKVAALLKLAEQDAFDFGNQPPVIEVAVPVGETPLVDNIKTEANKPEQIKVDKAQALSPPAQSKPDAVLELQEVVFEKGVAKQSASSSSQKKWFLILSLIAALIFSVINLRPIFFPEAPKEVLAEAPGMPVEAAPANSEPAPEEKASAPAAVSTPVVSAAVTPSTDCPPMDSSPATYRADAPKKAADMVYMQSKSAQMVCVIDALGKVQNKQLEPGVGVSVYGKAPLKVLTSGLDQVDLYFQGAKVRPASLSGKTIILEAAELTQPLAPTDSQLR